MVPGMKSSFRKFREHIVPRLHGCVACSAALGIVTLRWLVGGIGRPKTVGSGLVLEGPISPAAAVRKPLAVLDHEVHIVKSVGHERLTGIGFLFLSHPMNLCHLGAIGEGLAVLGDA